MSYRELNNHGQRWELPNGDPSDGERVSALPVHTDPANGAVQDPDTGEAYDHTTAITGADNEAPGEFSLQVPVTEGLEPPTELLLVRSGSWGSESYRAPIPAGAAAIQWSDLVDLGE